MSNPTAAGSFNPFPGLRPYRTEEEYMFFGRESLVDTMVDKLAQTRFLAVVGTSGSGKSSLVNCGLRPALHRGMMAKAGSGWRMAQFRPGSDPFRAMARALATEGVLFSGLGSAGLSMADMIEASLRMSKLGLVDVYEQAQPSERVNLLVVADQFEELFRYQMLRSAAAGAGQDRNQEAKAFVNLLLEAAAQTDFPIYIVLTMRSDFLGDCAEFTGLPEAINRGQYLVPRLAREERREAIAGPVGVGGGDISPVLLTRLVNDVGDNPDQLSILQHALNRTWAQWQNNGSGESCLELPDYEAIGTMSHALDQHAERAYAELTTERQRQICERTFKALTDRGTDARGIRRPMRLSTLCALAEATEAEVAQVIDVFRKPSRSFLMPPLSDSLQSDTVIDISHESLMRVWVRLKVWAEKEAESARTYRRLAETAALWASGGASLWRGAELAVALKWREEADPTEAWAGLYGGGFAQAMSFLTASEAERQAEEREKDERRKKESEQAQALALAQEQARTAQRLRRLSMAAGLLALLAVIFGGIAWRQSREAAAEATLDKQKKEEADSLRFAETAMASLGEIGDVDPERGVLLALEAADVTYRSSKSLTPEADHALRRALQAFRMQQSIPVRVGSSQTVRFTADGQRLAVVSGDWSAGEVTLADTESQKHLAPLEIPDGVRYSAVSPDGKYLATTRRDARGTVRIWDIANRRQVGGLLKHATPVKFLSFSADGRRLATVCGDSYVRLWDATSGALWKELSHGGAVTAVAFTQDGRLAAASEDKTTRLWDSDGNKSLIVRHQGRPTAIAISPDGRLLAAVSQGSPGLAVVGGGGGNVLTVWDLGGTSPKPVNLIAEGDIVALSFSPDGNTLLTVSALGAAAIWSEKYDRRLNPLAGHDIRVAAFSPDSTRLATAGSDKRATVWVLATGSELFTLAGHKRNITDIAYSPDGKRLATVSLDGTAKIWRAVSGPVLMELTGHQKGVYRVAYSADGNRLATASGDKTAKIWDAATGAEVRSLSGHADEVTGVAFSRDGGLIATSSADKTAKVWDARSGRLLLTLAGHREKVTAVALSPDGKRVATASVDRTARLWDSATGRQLLTLEHAGRVEDVAFSPDGMWLATASSDGLATVWESATGKARNKLPGHDRSRVFGVAFSPDGTRLATASADKTAIVCDFATGKEITQMTGHDGWVRSVAFSPDGKHLATASEDSTAKVWDSTSGAEVSTMDGHADKVFGVSFSPDGSRLVTAGADRKVLTYAWGNGKELMETARARTTRSLSAKECTAYKVVSEQCEYTKAADPLVANGLKLAGLGDIDGAIASFQEAKKVDPSLKLEPLTIEAIRIGAPVLLGKAFEFMRDDKFAEGKQAYLSAAGAYEKAKELDPDGKKRANAWNDTCWHGSLLGHAREVMETCSQAVKLAEGLEPEFWNTRDSRGLARALNHDFAGAIEDFEFFRIHTEDPALKEERQKWIEELRNGDNPFSPEAIKRLRS